MATCIRFITSWVAQWPAWWSGLTPLQKWGPLAAVAAYWGALSALHGFRPDHVNIGVSLLVLYYAGSAIRPLLKFLFPLLLTGIIYDSQRFYSDYIRGAIHVAEPYHFDKYFFGIPTVNGVLTPNEWWQLHTSPFLDVITGFMYLFFIGIYVLFAAYFYFYKYEKLGNTRLPKPIGMMWGFFWLNMLGYSTYYWYAAAPPWYVAEHGLGPADLSVAASSAGCARFDQVLGTHLFTGMYGRAADVFGAIPSLHVSYPFMAIYFAFRYSTGRVFAIVFYLLMCFSAVYLNHHYILDILWGTSYAILISVLIDRYYLKRTHATTLATSHPGFVQ